MALRILGISGSLRKASTNKGLLRESIQLAPKGLTITPFDVSEFPLYNEDLSHPKKPDLILRAYEAVAKSDALFFTAPQYNYNISPPLKNFIDWISRDESPLKGKLYGYAHSGMTLAGHIDKGLAISVEWLQMKAYKDNLVHVRATQQNFDADGNLKDEETKKKLKAYLEGFSEFVRKNKESKNTK